MIFAQLTMRSSLREPQNGRSFEYIGGEDPFLASQLVVPDVRGLQSENVRERAVENRYDVIKSGTVFDKNWDFQFHCNRVIV